MAVKMIVCDIDGTLVTDKEKVIPLVNIEALQKIQAAGILVTIASGRVPSSLYDYAAALGIINNCQYVVGSNGGAVLNLKTGEYVYDEVISYKDTLWAMTIVKEFGYDFYLAPLDEHKAFVSRKNVIEEDTFLFRNSDIKPEILDWNNIPQMRKVVISCHDETKQNWLRQQIAVSTTLRTEVTGYGFIEIIPKNVNKWQGILRLTAALKDNANIHIDWDEIMCFGDQMNDYEMIKNAKYGIALANATPELKEIATAVTRKDNNAAGIADYLYQTILK
ncbi:Cof-type HAD-IIB family hydrolase [Spiroplasma sp. SV19]|uniref:Cof-type HAD-IIB family hydrolase n=1 Tax=Spiroplasma sp. SV19 TaxID=2570468 RepID=UPI0024B6AB5B|nr:Cof-type HAD-IIB family hydrolase [Spiroplasma sp. SV19]WHQ37010.1 Cof-type HAD-IIB family hydrolase [Spiroplasma sp. SV19]